ncbi:methyltransferase domain-containing protein, partial [Streptomyces niveus]
RASAGTGHALATRLVPSLSGLADRLATAGSRILDIGTRTGALALALAQDLPHVHVTGIDSLERAVRLAGKELEKAGSDPPTESRCGIRTPSICANGISTT